jgi:hypothetical protein
MTELTLSHKIKALYQERNLASWERDFIADAYATSLGGNKPFHLSQKQVESVTSIFERVYQ